MTRTRWFVLTGLIALLLTTPAAHSTEQRKPDLGRPRFAVPQPGESHGWVDAHQYSTMSDPAKAAQLLIDEARMAHLNLDDSTHTCDKNASVTVAGRSLAYSRDKADVRLLASEIGREGSSNPVAVLVKYRRLPTIRERSEALSQGIRFSRPFGADAEVMVVPPARAQSLAEMSYVQWAEFYRPEYKYKPGLTLRRAPVNAVVESAIGDQEVCRRDLESLGITFQQDQTFDPGHYWVTMDPSRLGAVAQLWWVLQINGLPRLENGGM